MAGEPADAALAETRLLSMTCNPPTKEQIDAQIKEMRRAVDQSLREWRDTQPECWRQAREEAELERQSGGVPPPKAVMAARLASEQSMSSYAGDSLHTARSTSRTNNQVASVDEADIVKTDGTYVYFAANGALRIAEALKPRMLSVTRLAGTARELFVEGDRAVVYTASGDPGKRCTYGYDCNFAGDGTQTTISVFDIHDRAAPKLTRQIDLSGSLMAARRIGNAVHTVVADGDTEAPSLQTWPSDLEMCGSLEWTVKNELAKLKVENEKKIRAKTSAFPTLREKGIERPLCDGLLRTPIADGKAFTTVVSFDLGNDRSPPTSATLQSRPGAVFASANALYVSVVHQREAADRWYSFYRHVDEASEIHKFRIGASPRETTYVGSGIVPGHVLSQFAMDEWQGYLRVATTRGQVPDPGVESAVSILAETPGGNLARVGAVEHLAPGEDIRAVRFDDDRGYVVTFKKTDPLFVIDLYQPARPLILGALKIPGFSTYMHRIDPDHLLSIGFDADDHGDFAYFDGVILQLFDVQNPTNPRLVHKEKIGSRGSSSEAVTDHLAFNYFAEKKLLAIPMTTCEGGGDGNFGDLTFSGLLVYDVDVERGFTRLGGVDHGKKGASCNTWWSHATSAVKRSVFLDDLVYSIASDRVKVQRMGHFGKDVADLSLLQ